MFLDDEISRLLNTHHQHRPRSLPGDRAHHKVAIYRFVRPKVTAHVVWGNRSLSRDYTEMPLRTYMPHSQAWRPIGDEEPPMGCEAGRHNRGIAFAAKRRVKTQIIEIRLSRQRRRHGHDD